MIYTLTFNPSLDYIVTVPKFTCGMVNRTTEEIIFPGGKGINVSMVLKNLGFENTMMSTTRKLFALVTQSLNGLLTFLNFKEELDLLMQVLTLQSVTLPFLH